MMKYGILNKHKKDVHQSMFYEEPIVPELLPPYEDGVFKTLLTHEDAKPVLRDIVKASYGSL